MRTFVYFPELCGSDSYIPIDGRYGQQRINDIAQARAFRLIALNRLKVTHYQILKGSSLLNASVISTHTITVK